MSSCSTSTAASICQRILALHALSSRQGASQPGPERRGRGLCRAPRGRSSSASPEGSLSASPDIVLCGEALAGQQGGRVPLVIQHVCQWHQHAHHLPALAGRPECTRLHDLHKVPPTQEHSGLRIWCRPGCRVVHSLLLGWVPAGRMCGTCCCMSPWHLLCRGLKGLDQEGHPPPTQAAVPCNHAAWQPQSIPLGMPAHMLTNRSAPMHRQPRCIRGPSERSLWQGICSN